MRKHSLYTSFILLAGCTTVDSQDVRGQLGKLPVCAQACITHAFSMCKCPILNFQCACACSAFRSTSQECSTTSCSEAIVQSSLTTIDEMCKAMELRLSSQSSSATRSSASSRSLTTLSASAGTATIPLTITPLSFPQPLPTGSPIVNPQPSDGWNDASNIPSWGYASVIQPADTTRIPLSNSLPATPISDPSSTSPTDPRFSPLRVTADPTLTLPLPLTPTSIPSPTPPYPYDPPCWPAINATLRINGTWFRNGTSPEGIVLEYCSASANRTRSVSAGPASAAGPASNRSALAVTQTSSTLLSYGTGIYGTGGLNGTATTTSTLAQYTGGAGAQRVWDGWGIKLCAIVLVNWAVK